MGSTDGLSLSISTTYFFALIILFSLKDLCNTNDVVDKSGNNKNLEYMNCPVMCGHRLYLLCFPVCWFFAVFSSVKQIQKQSSQVSLVLTLIGN
jgi:hypothetical protein